MTVVGASSEGYGRPVGEGRWPRAKLFAQVLAFGALTSLCVSWALVALRVPNWNPRPVLNPLGAREWRRACFGGCREIWTVRPSPAKPERRDPAWPSPAGTMRDAYGWPWVFLQCEWTSEDPLDLWGGPGPVALDLHGGIRLESPDGAAVGYPGPLFRARALPLYPDGIGTAFDVVVWGLPWFGLAALWSRLSYDRRNRRWAAGMCVACEYPRVGGDGTVCPECGLVREFPHPTLRPFGAPWFTAGVVLLGASAVAIAFSAGPHRLASIVPPVHLAIRNHDHAALARLIESGASVSSAWSTPAGWSDTITPLMWAARLGDVRAIEQLLAAGAPLEATNRAGQTALFYALGAPTAEAFEALVERGANVRAVDKLGHTLLHEAARNAQAAAVTLLLRAGADLEQTNKDGQTPLWLAAWCADSATVDALLRGGADPNAPGTTGGPPLLSAAMYNDDKTVRLLLRAGADPNAKGTGGWTALMLAVRTFNWQNPNAQPARSLAVIRVLLEAGADPDAVADNGQVVDDLIGESPGPRLDPMPVKDQAEVRALLREIRAKRGKER